MKAVIDLSTDDETKQTVILTCTPQEVLAIRALTGGLAPEDIRRALRNNSFSYVTNNSTTNYEHLIRTDIHDELEEVCTILFPRPSILPF